MRLVEARIDGYGPVSGRRIPCPEGIAVVYGPNESGKTLSLEALLGLLEPDVTDALGGFDRVATDPAGRVVLETADGQHELGGDTTLSDVTDIDAESLANVFVVRDSDLDLQGGHSYFQSLTDRLGDVHTAEIEAVTEALLERGRITPTRKSLRSGEGDAGEISDKASALADEIREYRDEAVAEGYDSLETRRLSVASDLTDRRADARDLEEAALAAEHELLAGSLETYERATQELEELPDVTTETLEELRSAEVALSEKEGQREDIEDRIADRQTSLANCAEEETTLREALEAEQRRESAVEAAEAALADYRATDDEVTGTDGRRGFARVVAIAGLVGAGAAGAAGGLAGSGLAIAIGLALLLVALLAGAVYWRSQGRERTLEQARTAAVRAARDAGLEVDGVEDVAPAIEAVRTERDRLENRRTKVRAERETAKGELESDQGTLETLEGEIQGLEAELEKTLRAVDVEDVAAYADLVDRRTGLERERDGAAQRLDDWFGTPEDDPIDGWRRGIDEFVEDIDLEAVEPDEGARDRLAAVEADIDELETELEELDEQLTEHNRTLDRFDHRTRELDCSSFVEEQPVLEARSVEGLERLADALEAVVETIEWDAERSRKAIEIVEELEAEEERKIADLFDPDGPASSVFAALTDGRYETVTYDPEAHELCVTRSDGRTFRPEELSAGTADQLYLATRLSLAEQLLGGEPGVFLLDDAFLTADPDRLERGFDLLERLAGEGWQLLYFTAKGEVAELATDRGLERVDLEALPV